MSNFAVNASPSMNQFVNFGVGYSMIDITGAWNGLGYGFNRYSFASYQNSNFFRYTVGTSNGSYGTVSVNYPINSGTITGSYTTAWWKVGYPPYITIQASALYGRTFVGWYNYPGGTLLSMTNPWNVGWSDVSGNTIIAVFV